jgi:predicted porin
MKRISLSILAVSTTLAFSTDAARAQSSVTLYGIVDTGIAYIHNSGAEASQWKMSAGNLSGNQWGLRGTEDLGGGYSAIFQLENGFDIGSGQLQQGNREFGRQAFVGLSSASYGSVYLGRQYDPVSDLVQPITADQFSGIFATPGDIDNYDSSVRFDNAVKWVSPSWGGFTVEAMYGLGGIAGATGSGQTYSAAIGYAHGPLNLAAGYLHIDNGNPSHAPRGTSSADTLFNSPVNAAYASAGAVDITRAAAQYAIGPVTLGAAYSFSNYKADGYSTFGQSEKYHNGSVFALWQVAPDFQTIVGYNYTKSTGDSSARYHQVNLGVDYLLSKRTDIYATAAYQHASGSNGAGDAQAVVGSFDIESGANYQVIGIVGLRHKF